jgi:hypothetical protein
MVLVDQAAESIATLDSPGFEPWWRVGRPECVAAVGPLLVVVLEVLGKDAAEVVFVADEDPVEAVAADRADDAFGVGVGDGHPDGREDHADRFAGEDGVERAGELRVAVADQERESLEQAADRGVACLLGDPGAGRVRRDPREMDKPALAFDETPQLPS